MNSGRDTATTWQGHSDDMAGTQRSRGRDTATTWQGHSDDMAGTQRSRGRDARPCHASPPAHLPLASFARPVCARRAISACCADVHTRSTSRPSS
eukprot:352150-Chlamydomonas_euryale.AAC.2